MKFRLTVLLAALPAIVAALLVATPADASSHDAYLKSSTIVIHTDGTGRASISCHSSHTCKGTTKFDGGTRYRSFSVPGNSTQYVDVATASDHSDPAYPDSGIGEGNRTAAVLKVHETSPHDRQYQYNVNTETPVTSQQIQGTINAHPMGRMTKLKVELYRELRGGNIELLHTYPVTEGGSYHFNAKLGTNNHSSNPYQLKISGIDADGDSRSWYWRGASNATTGGSRYIRKATDVRATSFGPFVADFNYGSIKGKITNSSSDPADDAEVTVAAPPPPGSTAATNRDLDLASCADIHDRTKTDGSGNYQVDFLPYNPSGDKRYMVGVVKGSLTMWNGNFGSCLDTIDYTSNTRDNLYDLDASGGTVTKNFQLEPGNTVTVDGHTSGFTATGQGDRWITIREKVPGLTTLEDPVVASGLADSHADRTFSNLPPGDYLVELGRRTGCSDWYPSHFPNNDAYFKGLDRGSEVWKSFTKLSALSSSKRSLAEHANPNPAGSAQTKVPSGYHGWMYRDYCKAYGAGTINSMSISGFGGTVSKDTSTDTKGAVVKGHVSRTHGRTNKEIMVRLSSSRQTLVLRTDLTDGGGNFYIAGVASGTYTVSVNSDSWRGIGRAFSGHHTITVKAGHGYNLGTLHFTG